jgi:hypothetical protein
VPKEPAWRRTSFEILFEFRSNSLRFWLPPPRRSMGYEPRYLRANI